MKQLQILQILKEIPKTISFNNKNYVGFKYPLSVFLEKIIGFKIILVNLTNEYNELTKQSIYYALIIDLELF